MATLALNSQVQSFVAEYGMFWQYWPQFEQTNGERRMLGFEVELIGSHASSLDHVDPACPRCRDVRAALLAIAHVLPRETKVGENAITYDVDSHSNLILCLPALGSRSAVSVSIYVSWSRSNGQSFETDLLTDIKNLLSGWGIHQR